MHCSICDYVDIYSNDDYNICKQCFVPISGLLSLDQLKYMPFRIHDVIKDILCFPQYKQKIPDHIIYILNVLLNNDSLDNLNSYKKSRQNKQIREIWYYLYHNKKKPLFI